MAHCVRVARRRRRRSTAPDQLLGAVPGARVARVGHLHLDFDQLHWRQQEGLHQARYAARQRVQFVVLPAASAAVRRVGNRFVVECLRRWRRLGVGQRQVAARVLLDAEYDGVDEHGADEWRAHALVQGARRLALQRLAQTVKSARVLAVGHVLALNAHLFCVS